ncbi:MAG: hypothetical protein K5657_00525 [Desulfovibrio sp.]|nr:hypothetical protein [Desulfovibrio sp.]
MLFLLTLLHFSVDGLCGAALAAHDQAGTAYADILRLFALYNLIAFGGQWLVGLFSDVFPRRIPALFVLSLLALGAGLLPGPGCLFQGFVLGVGNCVFHAAGGSLILRSCNTYTEPGIFVSSGAIGLALGLNGVVPALFFLFLCASLTGTLLFLLRNHAVSGPSAVPDHDVPSRMALAACVILLLFCVTLRGFGGGGEAGSHILLFPCVFALGKASGGLLCDRIGYRNTLLLLFLLSFLALQIEGLLSPLLLAFAFNISMPLTLRLAHLCAPAYPGLVFGLAAGALLPGFFFGVLTSAIPPHVMAVALFLLLVAANALYTRYSPTERKRVSP